MKNIFIVLLLCVFSMSVSAQKKQPTRNRVKQPTTLVTKAMADKIAEPCLNNVGYCPTVFFDSNKEFLSASDILRGKADVILRSLYKYPKYSENFIYGIYQTWGYDGLRILGFTADEIVRCKKICSKYIAENRKLEREATARKVAEETKEENALVECIKSGNYIENISNHAQYHICTENLAEKLMAWRASECLSKTVTTWNKEFLNLYLSIGINLDKTIKVLNIDGEITPQKKFLAEWLKSNVVVDSLAVVKFPTINKVVPVPSRSHISIYDDFEFNILQYSLPVKLKMKRNEKGILYIANENSILKAFLVEDKTNAKAVLAFLKLTIASNPAFNIDKKQFSVTLTKVYKEYLKVQGEQRIHVGYVFDFLSTKEFNWNRHTVTQYG